MRKTTKSPISKALLDVWEAKKRILEETKDMTPDQVTRYFSDCSEKVAQELGKRWVKNDNGTYSLR
ncbi:MAG TPA: hypothetical protein PLI09_02895 [Candidatus Hydrogenedentes bacterium]|nr:hypothetical protein [Candidatus Hydrogenedentota bacterium]